MRRAVAAGMTLALILGVAGVRPPPALAQGAPADPDEALQFEQQIVVSVLRTEQELVDAPAAVGVIADRTIRQSPAGSVGELLRTVPGANVVSVSYTAGAYWQDVLDARYAGRTEPYTLVNGGIGRRWRHDRVETSLKVTNLLNREIVQHVFGDVFRRQIVGEVRIRPV